MAKSIGIDLGTTNSAASIKKVAVEIIENSEGELITPSCITVQKKKVLGIINKAKIIVGKHALEWIKQDPVNTVTAVKRLMGRSISNPEVQKIISNPRQANTILAQSRGTDNSLVIRLQEKEYRPEQISAEILKKIHKDAEIHLNDTVEYAVITVPAYFNDKQKHATRTAAALAGLKVQRLLPEPTAAAISFGVDQVTDDEARTIMVFDFGGGTFDLSVLTISAGQFLEQGKGGNMWMGGEDIDHKIEDFVLNETAREYDIEDMSQLLAQQEEGVKNRFLGELKRAVEQAKINLSDQEEAYVEILGGLKDADGDLLDVDITLTREHFEQIIQPVVENAMGLTQQLLEDIHFTRDLIDNVLLVGGSSKIPCIIRAVEKMFGPDKVLLHERPMLAIAEGAAILSHRLSDTYECTACGHTVTQTDTVCPECGFDLEGHTMAHGVLDIVHSTAHEYYVGLENGEKYLFVEKNTPLPCERTETFKLVDVNQELVHMKFFNIVNNVEESIGDFWLGIDKDNNLEDFHAFEKENPGQTLQIDVTLEIDENNLVAVSAALQGIPGVELSRTLSRGQADEKLFMALEEMINEANEKKYSDYTIDDMTTRIVAMVKDIHGLIDGNTGQVKESVYSFVEMSLDKTKRMAREKIDAYALIYYTEDLIDNFAMLLSIKDIYRIQKKINRLKKMNLTGTYEQNVKAYYDLYKCTDNYPMLNLITTIVRAGEVCDVHEPSRAVKFRKAVADIMDGVQNKNEEKVDTVLGEVMPEVGMVLQKYDRKTGTIQKGITR
jgi:molecular chaperone DnaK